MVTMRRHLDATHTIMRGTKILGRYSPAGPEPRARAPGFQASA